MYENCKICPRRCGVNREEAVGYCKSLENVRVARVGLHLWEEPCISYGKGSGTIFFSGCNLRCVYCQNHDISNDVKGRDISIDKLCDEMKRLEALGAVNINLVTTTHYSLSVARALEKVKTELSIPVVFNTGSYDLVETLKLFDGLVDIYLPDIKYYSQTYSKKYSSCPDYFEVAISAIKEMHRQTGYASIDENGRMKSGVLVRHLVLPSLYRDSFEILNALAREFVPSKMTVSIMNQYFPTYRASEFPEINRHTTTLEYQKVVNYALKLGFVHGYTQERTSAKEEYVPNFDY